MKKLVDDMDMGCTYYFFNLVRSVSMLSPYIWSLTNP